MIFENWKLETIDAILPEEFYQLILNNFDHIKNTFPITLSNCSDLEKTIDFIARNKKRQSEKDGYYFYLRNLESNKLIGYVCVKNVNQLIQKCELAYFIDQHFEGKGIISSALSQIIEFCFSELKMNKVFICTSRINKGSQRIAVKHRFIKEGVLRQEFRNGADILEDIVYFGLLKSDYIKE